MVLKTPGFVWRDRVIRAHVWTLWAFCHTALGPSGGPMPVSLADSSQMTEGAAIGVRPSWMMTGIVFPSRITVTAEVVLRSYLTLDGVFLNGPWSSGSIP